MGRMLGDGHTEEEIREAFDERIQEMFSKRKAAKSLAYQYGTTVEAIDQMSEPSLMIESAITLWDMPFA